MTYEYRGKVYNLRNIAWIEQGDPKYPLIYGQTITIGYNFSVGSGHGDGGADEFDFNFNQRIETLDFGSKEERDKAFKEIKDKMSFSHELQAMMIVHQVSEISDWIRSHT